jgi:hypothetical protein
VLIEQRMFYVYTINDPISGRPFYIGKGKGRRCYSHVEAVKRGTKDWNQAKIDKIKSILAMGLEPVVVIVERYEIEDDAFQHEIELIAVTEGLTNIAAGGQGRALDPRVAAERLKARDAARSKAMLRKMLAQWERWPGVTFPNIKDGEKQAAEFVDLVRKLVTDQDEKVS